MGRFPLLKRSIEHLEEGLMALLLASMTLLAFTQVVLRYVFNSGLIWALETNFYLFGWLIVLGASYAVRVHSHIGVDVVVKLLPQGPRRIVGLVAITGCIAYALIMLYGGWNYVERLHQLGIEAEDIPIERWILTIILPIGFALVVFRLGQQAWAIFKGEAAGFELADEAGDILRDQGLQAGGRARGGQP